MTADRFRGFAAAIAGVALLFAAACTTSVSGSAGPQDDGSQQTSAAPSTEQSLPQTQEETTEESIPGIGGSALCKKFCARTNALAGDKQCGIAGDASVCGDWVTKVAALAKDIAAAPEFASLSSSDKNDITTLQHDAETFTKNNCTHASSDNTTCLMALPSIAANVQLLKLTLQIA